MIALTRAYHFSASHRLHIDSLSEAQNQELYGKCNNPFGHGHNYRLEVSVAGPQDSATGQIVPLSELDRLVEQNILRLFDHRNMNSDVAEFVSRVPTTENVLTVIGERLLQSWSNYLPTSVRLHRLQIQETDRNSFEENYPTSLWQD